MLSLQTAALLLSVCVDTINLLVGWGPRKDRQGGSLFVDIFSLNISLFLIVHVYIYISPHWVPTER